jgi:hypothetical protein
LEYKIVISIIAIVSVLFISGITFQESFATHENTRDKSAYLFRTGGLGGGNDFGKDLTTFVTDNNGVVHLSQYNWIIQGAKTAGGFDTNKGCGTNPPAVFLGEPRGWTSIVDQYNQHLHTYPELKNHPAKVFMFGHSFGGGATTFVATDPRNSDIQFDLIWLSDPVGPNGNRYNVVHNVGWEHSPLPCAPNDIESSPPCISVLPLFLDPFGFFHLSYIACKGHDSPKYVFNNNVKTLFNFYQTPTVPPTDNFFAGGVDPFFAHASGVQALQAEIQCDPGDTIGDLFAELFGKCHGRVSGKGHDLIKDQMLLMNTYPSISTTEIFVDEGAESISVAGTDSPTRWESTNQMSLTFRLDPQVDGTEFSSAPTNPSPPTNLLTANFDGPSVQIKELQVEDNGFPCNNCTGANKDASKSALGKWDNESITIHVANVSPTVTLAKEPVFQSMNLHLTLSTTDPSDADTTAGFEYQIDWGDGPSEIIHGDAEQVYIHNYKFGKYTIKVTATDKDGGVSQEISIDVQTPFVKLIDNIGDLINDGTLNQGQGNSLKQKINAIGQDLEKDHLTPACNVVDAFYNELNAFVNSGILTEQQRDDLVAKTEIEKDTVGCNGKVIVVEKQTDPEGIPTQFEFTGDVVGTISDGQELRVRNLSSGEYESTEIVSPPWFVGDITCSDENSSGDLGLSKATFRVESDEFWVKCTFTNTTVLELIGIKEQISVGDNSSSDLSNTPDRSSLFTGKPSDNITDDKGSGGDKHLTRPTFGLSHETHSSVVDNGFRFNDQSFSINDNFHTPFAQQTVNIGEANSFEAKIYADKKLHVQEFLFGIPGTGQAHLAELGVEVWYDLNGEILEVKAVQKSNVIDKDTLVATHEKSKCQASDIEQKCDTTKISMVFLEPLKDYVVAVKAIDYKNRYQITYLNEGVEIVGESLNPMQTYLIPSSVRDEGLIQVTQTAKYSPYWEVDDGRLFEMNSFGSFKQINQTFERFEDTGNPYTRVHSGFGGIIAYEQKRASQVFDSSEYISELPNSFAYVYPKPYDRMTDELKAKMSEQEEIAKEIIEESKVQARW